MDVNLKNLILAGIGSLTYTYEKSSEMIETLVQKGEITVNQGKELNEELKKVLDKSEQEKANLNPQTLDNITMDIKDIKARLDVLEKN
ncbi:MAG TPA: hypothetical protein VK071_07855 [Tissierellales bacterium]|nr:hypothetical protein [Tissierellales bacterium]